MFESIRALAAALTGGGAAPNFDDTDYRVAAAAMFVHVAEADGHVVEAERQRMRALVSSRFGLDAAATARLLAQGERSEHEAADPFQFASALRRALDPEGRRKIVAMLRDIAGADGETHEFEDDYISRVAELLDVAGEETRQARP